MGKLSRNKGAGFERLVAVMLREALGAEKDEIMRTPLSGGHAMGDRGDLQISARIRPRFPFCVECKHNRDWRPGNFMTKTLGYLERSWLEQATAAASKTRLDLLPLLIVRGNRTPIFAALPVPPVATFPLDLGRYHPRMIFSDSALMWDTWELVLFEDFLHALSRVPYKKKGRKNA